MNPATYYRIIFHRDPILSRGDGYYFDCDGQPLKPEGSDTLSVYLVQLVSGIADPDKGTSEVAQQLLLSIMKAEGALNRTVAAMGRWIAELGLDDASPIKVAQLVESAAEMYHRPDAVRAYYQNERLVNVPNGDALARHIVYEIVFSTDGVEGMSKERTMQILGNLVISFAKATQRLHSIRDEIVQSSLL